MPLGPPDPQVNPRGWRLSTSMPVMPPGQTHHIDPCIGRFGPRHAIQQVGMQTVQITNWAEAPSVGKGRNLLVDAETVAERVFHVMVVVLAVAISVVHCVVME